MTTKQTQVTVTLSKGRNVEVTAFLAEGEKVVTASAAMSAVLTGKTIRPAFHDEKLQVRYVRGLGLKWVGEPEVLNKTLSGPEYLWKALNNEPDSVWIIPAEPTQRGRWFDGNLKTHVNIRTMTDGHLDNALSWLALKSTELKTEQKRRARATEEVEQEKTQKEAERQRIERKRAKAKARYEARQPVDIVGAEAVLKALADGKCIIQKKYSANIRAGGGYIAKMGGGIVFDDKSGFITGVTAEDLRSFAVDTFVEVK